MLYHFVYGNGRRGSYPGTQRPRCSKLGPRLTDLVVPWRGILEGDTKPQHARQVYVSSYALSLGALCFAGGAARTGHDDPSSSWTEILDGLAEIDWRKTNRDSQCRAHSHVWS